jgi:branched-chain amino acid transport system substrate-binding protein
LSAVRAGAAEPIKIGHVGVISGVPASLREGGLKAMQVFEKQVNEEGCILGRPVKLISRDTPAKPANAVTQLRKLILEDEVDFVLTTDTSAVILAETLM